MAIKKAIERVPAQSVLDWVAIIYATGFGSGYMPVAPGTAGTIVAVPIYLLLIGYLQLSLLPYLLIVSVITALGCLAAHRAGRHFGLIDAGHIVIDEIAGFLISMTGIAISWPAIIIGFILFRVGDILKPWPASYFDRKVANGFGVVMDDVMAGIYVLIIMQALNYFRVI